jgi:uncharacterized YigZ family protein
MDDSYLTIAAESKAEIKVKGSRFIAETFVVSDADMALDRLNRVRGREYNASHHCYAYIVGYGEPRTFRYSDAGEPSGTAGKPIHDVVAGSGATNILCVVTRYFGGTKLGTGGLVKAYGDAARKVMDKSGLVEEYFTSSFEFTVDFPLFDRWQRILQRLGAGVTQTEFSDTVTVRARIRNSMTEELLTAFTELTAGKGHFEKLTAD